MGSDSVMNGSVPAFSKDFGKKKRTNRLAKLKQGKLDAKREQWLSKGNNKECKEESNALHLTDVGNRPLGNSEMKSRGGDEHEGSRVHDSDVEFITNSPTSSVTENTDSRKFRPGSSCGSSSSGSGCYSGSITEEEEEDDGCLDDWEAIADALNDDDKCRPPKSDPPIEQETPVEAPHMASVAGDTGVLKSECKKGAPIVGNTRAWRPDDAFRPQSLPNLLKQHSFPVSWSCHSIISQPSSCPICYEDLDLTDSSFLPCSCGFHLCLFCHKRILEADGRCPGCRKQYDPINGNTGITGEAPQRRVTRSSSMNIKS